MAGSYHGLSIADKQRQQRLAQREPSVRCPWCDVALMPADLLVHLAERCTGPTEPHHTSAWLSWRDALALGVPKATLSRWAATGRVRTRGDKRAREYLLRDIAKNLAIRDFIGSGAPQTS